MYRRIRDLREDKDLMQKDVASYLNCSQVCYSYYEMFSTVKKILNGEMTLQDYFESLKLQYFQ